MNKPKRIISVVKPPSYPGLYVRVYGITAVAQLFYMVHETEIYKYDVKEVAMLEKCFNQVDNSIELLIEKYLLKEPEI